MTNKRYYIGLMSGTSADGVDIALVDFSKNHPTLIANTYQPYSPELRNKVLSLYLPSDNEIDRTHSLSVELSHFYADAIKRFLTENSLVAKQIIAIGNHGQTIRHRPIQQYPFTLQIGCHHTLAYLTNIRVIGDFRQKDMVYGGQGAPLVPAFHQALFASPQDDVFVVNIGGIANVSYLPKSDKHSIQGFDTGPGNALIDAWYDKVKQGRFDKNGAWAAQGTINIALLKALLNDTYFKKSAPKSTGREYFHLDWLYGYLTFIQKDTSIGSQISEQDIQATLTALTAHTIADAIKCIKQSGKVYLCGGGIFNHTLIKHISALLNGFEIHISDDIGINSEALEAMAFAWLAYAFDHQITGNIPSVTGAKQAVVLGLNYLP